MDYTTQQVSNYIREKGIKLSKMSRDTGIPYGALYDSLLHNDRNRDLRADEFLDICDFIGVDPKMFKKPENKQIS